MASGHGAATMRNSDERARRHRHTVRRIHQHHVEDARQRKRQRLHRCKHVAALPSDHGRTKRRYELKQGREARVAVRTRDVKHVDFCGVALAGAEHAMGSVAVQAHRLNGAGTPDARDALYNTAQSRDHGADSSKQNGTRLLSDHSFMTRRRDAPVQ